MRRVPNLTLGVNFPFEPQQRIRKLVWVNSWELMPVLLLLLFSIALSAGLSIMVAVVRQARRKRPPGPLDAAPTTCPYERTCLFRRPNCWLAIKSRNIPAVQLYLSVGFEVIGAREVFLKSSPRQHSPKRRKSSHLGG